MENRTIKNVTVNENGMLFIQEYENLIVERGRLRDIKNKLDILRECGNVNVHKYNSLYIQILELDMKVTEAINALREKIWNIEYE